MISWRGSRSWQGIAARARRYCPAKITTVSACLGHPMKSAIWACPFTKRSSAPTRSRRIYSTTSVIMNLLKIMAWLPGIYTALFLCTARNHTFSLEALYPLGQKYAGKQLLYGPVCSVEVNQEKFLRSRYQSAT